MGLRRPEDHYTYSKVMASVALDRADQTAIAKQLPGDVDRWRSYAASIRRLVLDRGGVTSADVHAVGREDDPPDAANLLFPLVGSLPVNDRRLSSAAIRLGPKPGWPSAKATIPCSCSGNS